ncbi:MAG TPA: amidohydrolase [Clostridiales bacterium UBA9856]|jgi:amidohydrolase|nr:amidohydrolase [Clostridiales bacterium UBA9856]
MDPEYLKQQVKDAAVRATMLRRELHQWPEPGNEEFRTAGIIERELKDLGLRVERPLPTGLICTIPCGSRTDSIKGVPQNVDDHERHGDIAVEKGIALRADMDGLPIEEKVSLSFSSSRKGYMHACGHDVHIAVLLGVARVIEKNRHMLKKDVKLIFQPAEETTGGAERMIAAGCLENPDISSVFGLHIKPELPAGKIGIKYGRVHAASDMFSIRIKGRGSHGAFPEKGVDALLTGCQVVNCLQTAVSRSVPAFEPAVLTVGTFRSGCAANVIAEEAILEGTIRSFDPEIGCALRRRTEDIVRFTALAAGAEGDVTFTKGYPALINDEQATDYLAQVARDIIGKENVIRLTEPTMSVDDFSYFLQKTKGSFFFLGSGFPDRENPPVHSGNLYVNEKCIETGILILSALCFK